MINTRLPPGDYDQGLGWLGAALPDAPAAAHLSQHIAGMFTMGSPSERGGR